jgi:hypothetical protein
VTGLGCHPPTTNIQDVTYIESNWFIPRNRDKVMRAWTVGHLHLGNTTTCRAEGIHSTIKRDIESKHIDLLFAWDAIDRVVRRQHTALDAQQREQRIGTKAHYEYKLFDLVRHVVSYKALDLTYKQFLLAQKSGPAPENQSFDYTACTRRYISSIGLPCKCLIAGRLQATPPQPLRIADFDSSWHLRSCR